ncbi:unnamed protein product [Caenorhabditis angaria]|uniref:Pepsin inhibitor-3-like repeated domain-containing protein n=1 Tax=Caenorhabditis angaria TaxID=860376 RepID=A0A9P1N8D3_9PELO|nr:unnamed protein product [Caenorhabditis angaria]
MISVVVLLSLLNFVTTFSYSNGANLGCIVTKNLLFSQGNLIRQLKKDETDAFKKYKKELHLFNTKINEAFDKAEENEAKNATVPPMPVRPSLPAFCTGADTTMYIFGACSVQNNKVYVGHVFARELEEKEKVKLAEFAKKIAAVQPGTTPPAEIYKGLEFCTEL